jgi:hypothetical protein
MGLSFKPNRGSARVPVWGDLKILMAFLPVRKCENINS